MSFLSCRRDTQTDISNARGRMRSADTDRAIATQDQPAWHRQRGVWVGHVTSLRWRSAAEGVTMPEGGRVKTKRSENPESNAGCSKATAELSSSGIGGLSAVETGADRRSFVAREGERSDWTTKVSERRRAGAGPVAADKAGVLVSWREGCELDELLAAQAVQAICLDHEWHNVDQRGVSIKGACV